MKIAVSGSCGSKNKPIVSKFETSEKIIVFEPSNTSFKIIDNTAVSKEKEFDLTLFIENRISILITNGISSQMFNELIKLGIQIFISDDVTVFDAFENFSNKKLKRLKHPLSHGVVML